MKRLLIGVLALFLTFSVAWTHAEGLLPSLTETIGKPMPSYGEALECYPDNETSNDDGSVTEQYINVSEEQFNTFSVYLEKEGATLQEYTVDNGILTATILADDATFFFQYDSQKNEVLVTYPKGTYNERLERVKTYYAEGESKRSEEDWAGAVEAFTNAGNYKDASEQILITYYTKGETKRAKQEWADAVDAFADAGDYSDAKDQITETYYQQAKALYEKGKYKESYDVLYTILDYKNVKEFILGDENLLNVAYDAKVNPYKTVGSVVTFGAYEQDNKTSNGPEKIEWKVLKVQDNKVLLVSVYTLDFRPYHDKDVSINWENCSLRKWLNSNFLNSAFSKEEQKFISVSVVKNKDNIDYYGNVTSKERDTKDQVFILNETEIVSYLSDYGSDITEYVSSLIPSDRKAFYRSGRYWIRTTTALSKNKDAPGYGAACFDKYSERGDPDGVKVDSYQPVRPALWLDLDKWSDFIMKDMLANGIQ